MRGATLFFRPRVKSGRPLPAWGRTRFWGSGGRRGLCRSEGLSSLLGAQAWGGPASWLLALYLFSIPGVGESKQASVLPRREAPSAQPLVRSNGAAPVAVRMEPGRSRMLAAAGSGRLLLQKFLWGSAGGNDWEGKDGSFCPWV